jgi:hypothetical protein
MPEVLNARARPPSGAEAAADDALVHAAHAADVHAAETPHSPYLVARLAGQKPNLYGSVKFAMVSREIRALGRKLGRPPRVLDLGCSTSISRHYLEMNGLDFEYCGVDYEAAFDPDIVMDVRDLYHQRAALPWTPDVIMLLDVLEHLPGKTPDIEAVMAACGALIPAHGLILVVVPQLYRLDRLKLSHLHYPEHHVRMTLGEWREIVSRRTRIDRVRGVGYLSCLSYAPMLSPWYREDNAWGDAFRFLRGRLFEWGPFRPAERALTAALGRTPGFKGWCNSSLLICRGRAGAPA